MYKRILSLVMVLVLLCTALPASADELTLLNAGEISSARRLIAMDGDAEGWQKGTAPTALMNALQVQQYLEWLLSDEIGGLMVQIFDSAEMLDMIQPGRGDSLDGISETLQRLNNQIAFYRDELEQGRLSIYNDLKRLSSGEELTEREQLRIALRVREDMAQLQQIIKNVADNAAKYSDLLAGHGLTFNKLLYAADTPNGEITDKAKQRLLNRAETLTNDEQKLIAAQNGTDFSVLVLSSKQFGFIVRDAKGVPLKDANVKVKLSAKPTTFREATTDKNGLATFMIQDFNPNKNNKVVVDVEITSDYRCTREMRSMTIRGGTSETVRLETYASQPFLRMACYNGSDFLSQQNTIFYTPKNDASQRIDILIDDLKKAKISGWLYLCYQTYDENGNVVDTEERRSFTSGTAVTFYGAYCQKLVPNSTLSVRVETTSFSKTYSTQLRVEKAVVEEPAFIDSKAISFTSGGLNFRFPSSIPFIGGSTMSLGIPGVNGQLAIDPSGYIQFAYGRNFQSEELSWKSESMRDKTQRMDDADKQTQRDANAIDNRVYKNAGATDQMKFLGNTTAAVTVFAGLQGRIKEDVSRFRLTGAGGVQAAFKGGYGWQFLVGGAIPMFAALDFTFALGTSFALALEANSDLSDPKFIFGNGQGLTIDILAELGVSAGMGVRGLLNVALRFFGNIAPKLRLTNPVSAAVTLAMGLEVTAQAFLVKWKQTLWKGTYGADSAANGSETPDEKLNSADVYTNIEAGVNTPSAPNTELPPKNGMAFAPDSEVEVFSRLDSLSQEIQYVTLTTTDGTSATSATFGFWITPVTDKGKRKGELVWYNLDNPANHGTVSPGEGADGWRTKETDYSFVIAGDGDLVGINILSGGFGSREDHKPTSSHMTLAVMQAVKKEDGTLALEFTMAAGYYLNDAWAARGTEQGAAYSGYSLSMPVIYFNKSAQDQWYMNATCNYEDINTGKTNGIISIERQRTGDGVKDSTATNDNPERGDYMSEPVTITRCLAAAQPVALRFDGASVGTGKSLSCYYRLSVTKEASSAMAETTGLFAHMNGTRMKLDENVVFFSPWVRHGAMYDHKEYLFYLKKGKADDGSDCYRLMGAQHRIGEGNFTCRDYDVAMYAENFKITTVNDGSPKGITYLYWTECVAPGDDSGYQSQEKYEVKCVRFDSEGNSMSEPFTLVELSQMPSSLHLMMDGTGYYTTELSSGKGQGDASAAVSQQLVRFAFSLQTAVSLTGVVSYDPCVCAGEYATLLFAVENTGNLPVSRFTVAVMEQGATTPLQLITVDCRDPLSAGANSSSGSAANSADYSVSRVDGIFDDINGDDWLVRTVGLTGADSDTPSVNSENLERKHTDLLMPGGVHTYRATFKVPDDWNGQKNLTAELGTVFALTHYSNSLNGGNANDISQEVGIDANGNYVDRDGNPSSASNDANALPFSKVKRAAAAEERSKDINVGSGDLMLDCQPYVDPNGAQYVRVNIVGRSDTATAFSPTLTAKLGNTTVFTYRFANPIDEDFGYTLDIPTKTLLGDRTSGEITFTVTDNLGENALGSEFASFDNERTVKLGKELYIVRQPESVSVVEGEDAVFTVVVSGGVPPYTYQWQRLNENGVWEDIPGANQSQLVIPSVSMSDNGARFRCVITDSAGDTVISNTAALSGGGATLTVWAQFPVTGDRAQPVLWAAAALLCAAALWLLLRRRKG